MLEGDWPALGPPPKTSTCSQRGNNEADAQRTDHKKRAPATLTIRLSPKSVVRELPIRSPSKFPAREAPGLAQDTKTRSPGKRSSIDGLMASEPRSPEKIDYSRISSLHKPPSPQENGQVYRKVQIARSAPKIVTPRPINENQTIQLISGGCFNWDADEDAHRWQKPLVQKPTTDDQAIGRYNAAEALRQKKIDARGLIAGKKPFSRLITPQTCGLMTLPPELADRILPSLLSRERRNLEATCQRVFAWVNSHVSVWDARTTAVACRPGASWMRGETPAGITCIEDLGRLPSGREEDRPSDLRLLRGICQTILHDPMRIVRLELASLDLLDTSILNSLLPYLGRLRYLVLRDCAKLTILSTRSLIEYCKRDPRNIGRRATLDLDFAPAPARWGNDQLNGHDEVAQFILCLSLLQRSASCGLDSALFDRGRLFEAYLRKLNRHFNASLQKHRAAILEARGGKWASDLADDLWKWTCQARKKVEVSTVHSRLLVDCTGCNMRKPYGCFGRGEMGAFDRDEIVTPQCWGCKFEDAYKPMGPRRHGTMESAEVDISLSHQVMKLSYNLEDFLPSHLQSPEIKAGVGMAVYNPDDEEQCADVIWEREIRRRFKARGKDWGMEPIKKGGFAKARPVPATEEEEERMDPVGTAWKRLPEREVAMKWWDTEKDKVDLTTLTNDQLAEKWATMLWDLSDPLDLQKLNQEYGWSERGKTSWTW